MIKKGEETKRIFGLDENEIEDIFDMIGWNMYMTPEQAARGLELFEKIGDDNPDQESSGTCKDLSKLNMIGLKKVLKELELKFLRV